jgi:hypothetical protein
MRWPKRWPLLTATFWLSMTPTRGSTVSSRTGGASLRQRLDQARSDPAGTAVTTATFPWKSSTAPTLRPTELGAYQLL